MDPAPLGAVDKPDLHLNEAAIPDHVEKSDPVFVVAGSERRIKKSAAERRLLVKADLVILPVCGLIWWITYLDRNCIGNARVMGLKKDLNMTADQFYNCLTMFFVGYIAFLLPANLTSRILKPNRSVGGAVICFGIVLCGMSQARNYSTVLALRILLGMGQAFVQFLTVYTSLWYKRDEVATRTAIFYSFPTISGSFGGLIAYGIQKHLTFEKTGRHPWSWLFIIEGVMAVGIGILAIIALPRLPDDLQKRGKKHWLFTEEEIDLAATRFASYNTAHERIKPKQLLELFKDPKSHFFALSQGAAVLGLGVVGSFLPTFISGFGFSALNTQLFTIIPYACAFCLVLLCGILSDTFNRKAPFLLTFFALGCLGYILLLACHNQSVEIFAACLITASCYVCVLLIPVWLAINTVGFTKRGCTWAYSEMYGLTWSIMGTRIYNTPPRYIKGHSVVLTLNALAFLCIVAAYFYMRRLNNMKEQLEKEYTDRGEAHPHIANHMTLEETGESHILFRYAL